MNRLHKWACNFNWWADTLKDHVVPWAVGETELGDCLLELGPGPGLTTELLAERVARVTAVEIESEAAEKLLEKFSGTNVDVVHGDATQLDFQPDSFSAAVAFTMLHHVPSQKLQNQLFSKVHRVLRPGGTFAGSDGLGSKAFSVVHWFDTAVPINPDQLPERLEAAGFVEIHVERGARDFRFHATKVPA